MQEKNRYLFHLRYRPPYHWQGMLSFLSARATPGVELVERATYRRSIALNGSCGYIEVSFDASTNSLIARIQFPDPRWLFVIVERIRGMFDLNADWLDIARTLRKDPALSKYIEAAPGLRVPGSWDGFELATRAIVGQQITVQGATTLTGRMVQLFGRPCSAEGLTHLFPTPEVLAEADLTRAGLTKSRSSTVQALARAVCDRKLCFGEVLDSRHFLESLCEIPGIGPWTAQYIAMRALGEPDAFPIGDVAIMRALQVTDMRQLEARAEVWRPWRAYAAMYLWRGAGNTTTDSKRRHSVRVAGHSRAKRAVLALS
jgi:AraC family transcriptional regulator of adaptative response / DNA-3-methyladenine glycosylase II